ncbi:MAG: maleylpyruvate isomerase family mycothiol-dependent enzyme [Labedaea sp.]
MYDYPMVDPETGAALYREARGRIVTVARALDAERLAVTVPACPLWTVKDLLAHFAGMASDMARDNVAGAPGEAWLADQVAARSGRGVEELIAEWEEQGSRWEEIARRAEHPSFLVRNPYLDTAVYEADLYAALGLPRPPAEVTLAIVDSVVPRVAEDFDDLGLYLVTTPDREYPLGLGHAVASATTETYELMRAMFGRRSRAQIEGWEWSEPPGAFAERLPILPQVESDLFD